MALAFMGADVIKVERPGVESAQGPLNRLVMNTNKRSITLDLKDAAGRRTLLDLAKL
jgi:crotonobetainyl-CoA:carnitine CoA-transferase CaiB-like acyl-CoA transferase